MEALLAAIRSKKAELDRLRPLSDAALRRLQKHYDAVLWMRGLAAQDALVCESTVRELRRRIVARGEPGIAGLYGQHRRRIAGSPVVLAGRPGYRRMGTRLGPLLPLDAGDQPCAAAVEQV